MSNLQLQPGKWYRQRDGGKAYVAAELPEELVNFGYIDRFIGIDSAGCRQTWRLDGKFHQSGTPSKLDLVAEWVDEPTDAEIAEAVRWCCEQAARFYPCDSPRHFVDAVNEYREREGA